MIKFRQFFFHLLPLLRFFFLLSCFTAFVLVVPMPTVLLLQLYLAVTFLPFWSWVECHLLQEVSPYGLI